MNNPLSFQSLLTETSLPFEPEVLIALEQAFLLVQQRLRNFANEPDFNQKLALAFGNSFDAKAAQGLAQAWQDGDFSVIPDIELLSSSELNGANGAYGAATERIYLSMDFVIGHQEDLAAIVNLLLEELGHRIDGLLNGNEDSEGDEGRIFAALV